MGSKREINSLVFNIESEPKADANMKQSLVGFFECSKQLLRMFGPA